MHCCFFLIPEGKCSHYSLSAYKYNTENELFFLFVLLFISLGPFVIAKKMKNIITWGSREVITMSLEVNLEMEEAWYFSLFQSYTDEVILGLQ